MSYFVADLKFVTSTFGDFSSLGCPKWLCCKYVHQVNRLFLQRDIVMAQSECWPPINCCVII